MPLPILVLLERHWDVEAKSALMHALPTLAHYGYDTLCFESPSDLDEKETIDTVNQTVDFIQEQLKLTESFLKRAGIDTSDLCNRSYLSLANDLMYYVSSKKYKELASMLKELPGHQAKLKTIDAAKEKGMTIKGIDLTADELEPITNMEAQLNVKQRLKGIDTLDNQRIRSFIENMVSLQHQGKGVIFTMGQFHYKRLVEELGKDCYLKEIVFLHPHSPKFLDEDYPDTHNFLEPIEEYAKDITMVDKAIHNQANLLEFVDLLDKAIQSRCELHQTIQPTHATLALSKSTGLDFEAVLRPSQYVDCYHQLKKEEKIEKAIELLDANGIKGHFAFFKGVESYCVPCVNKTSIGHSINKMI